MKHLLLGAALASGLVAFGIRGFSQERDKAYGVEGGLQPARGLSLAPSAGLKSRAD